jgi:hypothetical protein
LRFTARGGGFREYSGGDRHEVLFATSRRRKAKFDTDEGIKKHIRQRDAGE